jgi:hypothetical protein
MSPVRVIQIFPTPLNCEAQFRMVLLAPSEVVKFYLTLTSDTTVALSFAKPHASIVQENALSYVFKSPRLKVPGTWRLEWLTDVGACENRGLVFIVDQVTSPLLISDVANWMDNPSVSALGILPAPLPMLI